MNLPQDLQEIYDGFVLVPPELGSLIQNYGAEGGPSFMQVKRKLPPRLGKLLKKKKGVNFFRSVAGLSWWWFVVWACLYVFLRECKSHARSILTE
ncbi:MAG: hypothetical protein IPJ88_10635 [Myxococcales bacterium]|nr:MAG: hypothetical protein IPJ88_10635 [Myxococcales bacterium]